jgi:hypothetical protein
MSNNLRQPVGMPSSPLTTAILCHEDHNSLVLHHPTVCEYLTRPYLVSLTEENLWLKVLDGMSKRLDDPEIVVDQAPLKIELERAPKELWNLGEPDSHIRSAQ